MASPVPSRHGDPSHSPRRALAVLVALALPGAATVATLRFCARPDAASASEPSTRGELAETPSSEPAPPAAEPSPTPERAPQPPPPTVAAAEPRAVAPTAAVPSPVEPPPAAPAPVADAATNERAAAAIARGIEGARTLRAQMDSLEARLIQAGAPADRARSLRDTMSSQQAALWLSQLEAGDPEWRPRVDAYNGERETIERDESRTAAQRAEALEALRRRAFGDDSERLSAWETLQGMLRTTPRDAARSAEHHEPLASPA